MKTLARRDGDVYPHHRREDVRVDRERDRRGRAVREDRQRRWIPRPHRLHRRTEEVSGLEGTADRHAGTLQRAWDQRVVPRPHYETTMKEPDRNAPTAADSASVEGSVFMGLCRLVSA